MTALNLIYEQKVKSLAEFCIIKCFNELPITGIDATGVMRGITHINSPTQIVSRGGDALNYYYYNNNFTPTHDWDFGIMEISDSDTSPLYNQVWFNNKIFEVNNIMDHLTDSLNFFFDNNNGIVIDPRYFNLRFRSVWGIGNRLKSISYNYTDQTESSITHVGAIVDMYIYGNVEPGVNYIDQNGIAQIVRNDDHWGSKNIRDDTNNDYTQRLPPLNGSLPKNFLFFNKIDIVVRDFKSNMSYIAPGDLLNDTLRMIYQSIYNININPLNNKLIKYLKKYSKLVKTLNNIYTICPNNSCLNVPPMTIIRDTDLLDCNNGIIDNMTTFTASIYDRLQTRGFLNSKNLERYKANIPSSKLCEIIRVLEDVPSIARQNSQ